MEVHYSISSTFVYVWKFPWYFPLPCMSSLYIQGLSGKCPATVCTCLNNDDFTVLVSGGSRCLEWACVLCGHSIQNERVEQWICIKFCIKFEHYSAEIIWMIQKASRNSAMSAMEIKVWHKCFKDGQEPVESDTHFGGLQ